MPNREKDIVRFFEESDGNAIKHSDEEIATNQRIPELASEQAAPGNKNLRLSAADKWLDGDIENDGEESHQESPADGHENQEDFIEIGNMVGAQSPHDEKR